LRTGRQRRIESWRFQAPQIILRFSECDALLMNQPISDIRIAVADDHPVIRHAVVATVNRVPGMRVAASAASGGELLDALQADPFDLIVTDLSMHGVQTERDGLHLIEQIKRLYPDTPVIVFTMLANRDVLYELDQMDVAGIVSKSDNLAAFMQALQDVAFHRIRYRSANVQAILEQASATQPAGAAPLLTGKELEVLRLYGTGRSLTEIAAHFNRSVSTVATQKASAMRKLGMSTNAEVIRYARANRLIP
jgi:two-component system, NarL family, captular synthesis response regulator RcsB